VTKIVGLLGATLGLCGLVGTGARSSIYIIPSDSMRPTLTSGDVVWCMHRLEISRGDVIVFRHPQIGIGIKRVAGLSGDSVSYVRKELFVNEIGAKKILKRKLSATDPADLEFDETLFNKSFEIQEVFGGSLTDGRSEGAGYFVIGDNRDNSIDSRQLGRISGASVVCKAVAIIATEVAGEMTFSRIRWL
jgi:signal peptidase I